MKYTVHTTTHEFREG